MTHEQKWTLANHARLTDKAVREYNAAKESLTAFTTAANSASAPSPVRGSSSVPVEAVQELMRATDHLENCVNAAKRAGRYHRHFLSYAGYDGAGIDELFMPIKEFREKIEHMDRDLQEG